MQTPVVLFLLSGLIADPHVPTTSFLRFTPAGAGLYTFDTGRLRGRLKVDGKYQGIYPLYDVATGVELTHAPGMFSPYHVFTAGREIGVARDWPTRTRLLPDGSVEVHWSADDDRPFAMTAVYRLTALDTLDFQMTVTPDRGLAHFELFLSSYLSKALWFEAAVYLPRHASGRRVLVPVERGGTQARQYVMFPRDPSATELIRDGRWRGFVDWQLGPVGAFPLMIRREPQHGFTAVMMAPPADCFAVACPWNPPTANANVYRSFYQSLFGCDLKTNQPARAACRLIIGRNLADADVLERFAKYAGIKLEQPPAKSVPELEPRWAR
jgi:hypothetical protein